MAQNYLVSVAAASLALTPDPSTVCPCDHVSHAVAAGSTPIHSNDERQFLCFFVMFDTYVRWFAFSALVMQLFPQSVLISYRKLSRCSAKPKTWPRPSTMLRDAMIMALEPLRTRQKLCIGIPRCALSTGTPMAHMCSLFFITSALSLMQ